MVEEFIMDWYFSYLSAISSIGSAVETQDLFWIWWRDTVHCGEAPTWVYHSTKPHFFIGIMFSNRLKERSSSESKNQQARWVRVPHTWSSRSVQCILRSSVQEEHMKLSWGHLSTIKNIAPHAFTYVSESMSLLYMWTTSLARPC